MWARFHHWLKMCYYCQDKVDGQRFRYMPVRAVCHTLFPEKLMYYSTTIAYILWALGGFGALGLHRFYLRKFPSGFLWLFSGGLMYVGAIYDFLTLPSQVRAANLKAGYEAALTGGGTVHVVRERVVEPEFVVQPSRETLEKAILRVARKNRGLATPGEVAIESSFSVDEARAELEEMAGKGLCEMRVRPSGVIVYRFPEFAAGEEGFEPGL